MGQAISRFCSVEADIIEHVRRYDAAVASTVLGVDLENRWSLLTHAPGIDAGSRICRLCRRW
ncbi:hypothetical protein ACQPXM_11865 [Kribbella sp. CA-253562]|uniref:hypothetical protein n=1 Tax=Kribbella sp. CA-253562 TaxID=3239942 RepID=UPI003D8B0E74